MIGACCVCGRRFSFHPNLVPSVRMKDGKPAADGVREPVCKKCVEVMNIAREKAGMEPIVPSPRAYDAADENEIE